jgi:glycosyltransferase involved in cell wall biosynthesis
MTKLTSFPKVSIVIPVFNGSNFMKEAIDSALAQTYPNIEVLVVNDGSNDEGITEEIALSYGSKIRYISKSNGGVSSALNLGIKRMTGDYFSWLSHDDTYKPNKIQSQMEYLQSIGNSETILYGGYEIINEKSKIIDVIDFSKLYSISKLNVPLFPVLRGLANGCTMLIHKNHFERIGLFDESLRTTQDYELWYRMFRKTHIHFCPGILVQSRVHQNQTGRINDKHIEECEDLWISMINNISYDEMIEIDGSAYHFYHKTADFLKNHSFNIKAEKHARQLAQKEIEKNEGEIPFLEVLEDSTKITMSSGGPIKLLKRLFYNIKYDGYRVTIIKIIRKLR